MIRCMRRHPLVLRLAGGLPTVAVALLSAVAVASGAASEEPRVRLDRSCEKTAKSQRALDECAYSELDQLRPQLAAALSAEVARYGKRIVNEAEAQWLAFRAAECRLEAGIYTGGSIYPLIYTSCEVALTSARIAEVRQVVANTPH
jgi:uncharacterized protein YecT (DUF1311 family)